MNANLERLRIGDIQLDIERQTVTRGGNSIEMAGLSFQLLKVLADRWPAAVSRRELAKEVWGDVIVSDDALRQRIRLLRISLGESEYIAAVKGVGYRLARPVRKADLSGRRRKFIVVASLVAIGVLTYVMLSGDLAYDLIHVFRHAMRH